MARSSMCSCSLIVGHLCTAFAHCIGGKETQVPLSTRAALRSSGGLWYNVCD